MAIASVIVRKVPDLPVVVEELLRQLPRGRVATYGGVAAAIGDPIAARWVGAYLVSDEHRAARGIDHMDRQRRVAADAFCPCHRVVRADGTVGAYAHGTGDAKRSLLEQEGIPFRSPDRVDLASVPVAELRSEQPLAQLREWQSEIARQAVWCGGPASDLPATVGGVDISYVPHTELAVATYALVDANSRQLLAHHSLRQRIGFPYITSYLAFRELPLMRAAVQQAEREGALGDVTIVDGSGILHPRRAGLATMLGVTAGITTIGVTKTHLWGEPSTASAGAEATGAADGWLPLRIDGQTIGAVICSSGVGRRASARVSQRPIYVSPGHLIDVCSAARIVRQLVGPHRLPEPQYWADRLSRQEARGLANNLRQGETI